MGKQLARKVQWDGMGFDSLGELSCYKKLISEFGKDNVLREPKRFIIATGKRQSNVFRSYGKMMSDRKFPHDDSDKLFTPDFVVLHKGRKHIIEFKNAFTQSADYPLRRFIFLNSHQYGYYDSYFEPKSQSEVREAIYIILNKDWDASN